MFAFKVTMMNILRKCWQKTVLTSVLMTVTVMQALTADGHVILQMERMGFTMILQTNNVVVSIGQ